MNVFLPSAGLHARIIGAGLGEPDPTGVEPDAPCGVRARGPERGEPRDEPHGLVRNPRGVDGMHFDVFLAAPISTLQPGDQYSSGRRDALAVKGSLLRSLPGGAVYYAGEGISDQGGFDSPDEALQKDMEALSASRAFVMLYPDPHVSSVLIEAGIALALNLPIAIITKDRSTLPFLLRAADRNTRSYESQTIDTTLELIPEITRQLFQAAQASRPG